MNDHQYVIVIQLHAGALRGEKTYTVEREQRGVTAK